MNVGFFAGLGLAAAIIVGDSLLSRGKYKKKHEEEKLEYQRKIEYNKTHLPSKELPPLSPDWDRIEEIAKETRFALNDIGNCYEYTVLHNYEWKRFSISKSELSDDTVKLVDMLLKDIDWFYAHLTGNSVGECGTVLESFLREKYPMLSADSISKITHRYCVNIR